MAKTSSTEIKKAPTAAGRGPRATSPERKHVVDAFEAAIKLRDDGKIEKARAAFEKLADCGHADIADRARSYSRGCHRSDHEKPTFASPQEECDYAVSLMNVGNYPDAKKHFEAVLKRSPKADYAMYALSVLYSMTEEVDEALQMLSDAIEADPSNRLHARSDGDFQNIVDDPRFTELLYPEVQ